MQIDLLVASKHFLYVYLLFLESRGINGGNTVVYMEGKITRMEIILTRLLLLVTCASAKWGYWSLWSFVLQDNVFVNVVASIQYRALADKASDAFYKLSNTRTQIQAYVFDGINWKSYWYYTDMYVTWCDILLGLITIPVFCICLELKLYLSQILSAKWSFLFHEISNQS